LGAHHMDHMESMFHVVHYD